MTGIKSVQRPLNRFSLFTFCRGRNSLPALPKILDWLLQAVLRHDASVSCSNGAGRCSDYHVLSTQVGDVSSVSGAAIEHTCSRRSAALVGNGKAIPVAIAV